MRRARVGRPGLLGTAARTAVVAGTATAVSNKVAMKQADRRAEQMAQQQPAAPQYQQAPAPAPAHTPPSAAAPAGGESTADQIARLANLHAQGLLTAEEFAAAKAKILGI